MKAFHPYYIARIVPHQGVLRVSVKKSRKSLPYRDQAIALRDWGIVCFPASFEQVGGSRSQESTRFGNKGVRLANGSEVSALLPNEQQAFASRAAPTAFPLAYSPVRCGCCVGAAPKAKRGHGLHAAPRGTALTTTVPAQCQLETTAHPT